MLVKGDIVKIKAEYQDPGDEAFTWVACDDEEKGRVMISPVDIGLPLPPKQVVNVDMLEGRAL